MYNIIITLYKSYSSYLFNTVDFGTYRVEKSNLNLPDISFAMIPLTSKAASPDNTYIVVQPGKCASATLAFVTLRLFHEMDIEIR